MQPLLTASTPTSTDADHPSRMTSEDCLAQKHNGSTGNVYTVRQTTTGDRLVHPFLTPLHPLHYLPVYLQLSYFSHLFQSHRTPLEIFPKSHSHIRRCLSFLFSFLLSSFYFILILIFPFSFYSQPNGVFRSRPCHPPYRLNYDFSRRIHRLFMLTPCYLLALPPCLLRPL